MNPEIASHCNTLLVEFMSHVKTSPKIDKTNYISSSNMVDCSKSDRKEWRIRTLIGCEWCLDSAQ